MAGYVLQSLDDPQKTLAFAKRAYGTSCRIFGEDCVQTVRLYVVRYLMDADMTSGRLLVRALAITGDYKSAVSHQRLLVQKLIQLVPFSLHEV